MFETNNPIYKMDIMKYPYIYKCTCTYIYIYIHILYVYSQDSLFLNAVSVVLPFWSKRRPLGSMHIFMASTTVQ